MLKVLFLVRKIDDPDPDTGSQNLADPTDLG